LIIFDRYENYRNTDIFHTIQILGLYIVIFLVEYSSFIIFK
jgi:hypothetical protein